MGDIHPGAELAPRAIITRAVHQQIARGDGAFLDCSKIPGVSIENHYPEVYRACMVAGIDPSLEPIPVIPAAHYHVGGLRTDIGQQQMTG